jgi:sensor c-di-GMP phosphodiesterase-like protein
VPITAEGVESEQIRTALAGFGCGEAQGWLFGKAISGEDVRAFLSAGGGENASSAEGVAAEQPPRKRKAGRSG